MKKICVLSALFLFLTSIPIKICAQECIIEWAGYNYQYGYAESGSVRTSETSMTEQAAREARTAIFGSCDNPYLETDLGCSDNCCTCKYSHYDLSEYSSTCLDGEYKQRAIYITPSGPVFNTLQQGTWIVTCQTLVELSSFSATSKAGNVLLEWTTASEIDNAGFNLYRAESEDGEYVKINGSLIPAEGSPTQGASYEFIDKDVKNRKTYYYKLKDIDLNGTSTMHGPVSVTPRLINNR